MTRPHDRSPSPQPKRVKVAHRAENSHTHPTSTTQDSHSLDLKIDSDLTTYFATDVLHYAYIERLNASYRTSEPFKHAVVEKLFQDDLLQKVKDECLNELSFTEKETDIYKVKQTGDLASLSYLTPSQVSLLPNLLTLRNALYSPTFRAFLRAVTGCGPLSGTKQDMSVNSYTRGCHLLNHDDVIGSRRVSYILYMPLPHHQMWQPDWGGALELYPTNEQGEPDCAPVKRIPPSWNQFLFFEVQPGKSFHSVEEVVVGQGEDGRERLSISGWFHAAQEGEEGYVPETETKKESKSSREQLTSTTTAFKSYPDTTEPPLPETALSEEHISFLSEFLNSVYLQPRTMKALASRFVEESSLELHSFLSAPLATKLNTCLRDHDGKDGLGRTRTHQIPSHNAGTSSSHTWTLKGPPHKWRYCVLRPPNTGGVSEAVTPRAAHASSNEILRSIQDELFTSAAFRAWMAGVSNLLPLRYAVEARRFRPGLDYTLATSEEREARLDVVLGLTPDVESEGGGQDIRDKLYVYDGRAQTGWQAGEWGGWECYMAPHDEEDDPAVYRSSSHKAVPPTSNGTHARGRSHESNGKSASEHSRGRSSAEEGEDDDDDDSTLLTVQPGFNRLLLVLRDEGVMRFVKYVSAAAEGSRWDVCGEYEVGMVQEEESST